jgi:hypothetical protein
MIRWYKTGTNSHGLAVDDFSFRIIETKTWNSTGTANWSVAENWTPEGVPAENSFIIVNSGELVVNSSVSALNVTVNAGAAVTIGSGVTLTADKVTLKTDASRNAASLINIGTLTAISVEYQRYMPIGAFEYVSAPIASQTASVFGTLGTNSSLGNGLFTFDVSSNAWSVAITNGASPISAMKGYAFIANSNQTITFSGTDFYSGEQSIGLDKGASTGFNLVGNPYPSAINWATGAGWTRSANVDPVIWINTADAPSASNFATFNYETPEASTNWASTIGTDEGVIAPTQAFWVYTTDNVSLAVNSAAQVHSSNVLNKKATTTNPLIRLQAQRSGYTDEMVIYFHDSATENLDKYDTRKKLGSGAYPQIYASITDAILAVNSLPKAMLSDSLVVPITFQTAIKGVCSIVLTKIEGIEENLDLLLVDKTLGVTTNLRESSSYSFDASTTSAIKDRFEVIISKTSTTSTGINTQSPISMFTSGKTIYINNSERNGQLVVYNSVGMQMLTQRLNGNSLETISTNLPTGIYLVTVQSKAGKVTKRVFVE